MYIVSFKTLTSAQRAGAVLKASGIGYSVVGIDPGLTKRGCSYGLNIYNADKDTVTDILNKKGVSYGDIFLR